MKTIDLVQLLDGKTIDEAIVLLWRIKKKHPDAKLNSNYEWDSTQLYVEYPRNRKHGTRKTSPPRELTPAEKLAQKLEMQFLFGPLSKS